MRQRGLQDDFLRWFRRGVTGLGLLVIVMSVGQGVNGIVGVVILMLLISAGTSLVLWVGRKLEGLAERIGVRS